MNRPKRAALGMLLAACVSDVTVARGNVFVGSVLYPLNVPTGVQNLSDFNALTSGGIGAGDGTTSAGNLNALEWSATGAVTNLNPTSAGITYSSAQGACGSQQVGYGYGATATFGLYQAYLWTGSAASAVNLNPYQLDDLASAAYATDGSTQVGYGETGTNVVGAVLWTGSAISAVSLNPTGLGFTQSTAYGVGGGEEVGVAGSSNIAANAVLWKGTAASAINLNPSQLDITQSTAMNTDGILQVGYGSGPNTGVDNNGNPLTHALLWDGSAATAVDLNPGSLNVFESVATAVGGGVEAGYGYLTSGYGNALAWTGTAASAVDLQTVLPTSGTWTDSYALN
ncbi:MAG TPA: hypothetical protein VL992_15170, partial [Tepidisphaeraceae bacterium]|nr:hypothetical protein [Tepidisphaeraceae bacterium]